MPASDQGTSHERYMLVPRTLVFLTREHEVLLLKGAPTKRLWANLYNGIGGHIECGEDALQAASREVHEETGLIVQDLHLCGTVTIDTGQNPGILLFVFKGQGPSGELKSSSEGSLEWISLDQLDQVPLVEDLPELLPRVLRYQPQNGLFYGRYFYNAQDELVIQFNR